MMTCTKCIHHRSGGGLRHDVDVSGPPPPDLGGPEVPGSGWGRWAAALGEAAPQVGVRRQRDHSGRGCGIRPSAGLRAVTAPDAPSAVSTADGCHRYRPMASSTLRAIDRLRTSPCIRSSVFSFRSRVNSARSDSLSGAAPPSRVCRALVAQFPSVPAFAPSSRAICATRHAAVAQQIHVVDRRAGGHPRQERGHPSRPLAALIGRRVQRGLHLEMPLGISTSAHRTAPTLTGVSRLRDHQRGRRDPQEGSRLRCAALRPPHAPRRPPRAGSPAHPSSARLSDRWSCAPRPRRGSARCRRA